MNDSSKMPFGIHQGKTLANVPANYLIWLHENQKCNGELKQYIENNMDVLKAETKQKRI